MRTAKRIIAVMRVTGIVLLCLAILFSVYSLANTTARRTALFNELKSRGAEPGITDALSFDSAMFRALSQASYRSKGSVNLRVKELMSYFSHFSEMAEASQTDTDGEAYTASLERLSEGSYAQTFIEKYESTEDSKEEALTAELISALDTLSTPVSKTGKVLPKSKNSTCRPALESAYAALSEGRTEEEAGSFYEYVEVVSALVNEAGSKDVSGFISGMTEEDYLTALAAQRAKEDAVRKTPSELMYEALTSETFDAASALDTLMSGYKSTYGTEPEKGLFAEAVCRLVIDEGSADFKYSDIRSAVSKVSAERENASFNAYLTNMCNELIDDASQRSEIPGVWLFYLIASCTFLMWVISLLLLIVSGVWDHLLTASILRRTEHTANAETDANAPLLRVEHLKQYFGKGDAVTRAVDDVSFEIRKGEVFGLVGESGCGKTTTGRTIINLYDPTDGDVYLSGLRISSTKGGIATYRSAERAKCRSQIRSLRYETDAAIKAEPAKKAELEKAFREKSAALRKDLNERLDAAEIHAIESAAEKSRCTKRFREARKAELTRIYEREIQALSGSEAKEREKRYKEDLRAASKETVMSRMQMIFQDPIASIDPRMTVREIIAEGLIIRGMHDKAEINRRVDEMLELVGLVPEHADRYPHEFSGGQRQRIGIARAVIMEPDLIIADEPVSALDVSIQAQVLNLLNDLRERMGLTILFVAHNLSVVKYFSDRIGVMYYGKLVEVADSAELFAHPMHPYTRALLSAIPYPDPYYEKHRTRIVYKPEPVPAGETEALREVTPGHYVHCTEAEFGRLRKGTV